MMVMNEISRKPAHAVAELFFVVSMWLWVY